MMRELSNAYSLALAFSDVAIDENLPHGLGPLDRLRGHCARGLTFA